MNTDINDRNVYEHGLSTVAMVIIAAVVIGGGAVIFSNGSSTEVTNDTATTTGEATTTEEAVAGEDTTTLFECSDGEVVSANFMSDDQVEVTLPSGEVKVVTQTEADSGTRYVTSDSSFSFLNQEQEATIEQDGEVLFEGCVVTQQEDASTATSSSQSSATTSIETEVETTATTSVESDAGVEVDADAEAQLQTDMQTETDAE